MFVVYNLLTQKQALFAFKGITKWFKDNPDRDDCITESFTVRRGHIKEDILSNSAKGVTLTAKATKKKVVKKKVLKKSSAKKASKKKVK
jgi:hypothetical protein